MLARGQNLKSARRSIEENFRKNPWIVLDNHDLALWDFLRELHDSAGMDNSVLSSLRVCKNFGWLHGSVCIRDLSNKAEPGDLVGLLKFLRDSPSDALPAIKCADLRLRGEISQQLMYLGYPLEDIFFEDADSEALSVKGLMRRVRYADRQISAHLRNALWTSRLHYLLGRIEARLCGNDGFRFGLFASKKSGKSTLLNCFLGEHLALADSELATPCVVSYRANKDGKYRLEGEDVHFYPQNGKELSSKLHCLFAKAQHDAKGLFARADLNIEYPGGQNLLPDWTLLDTPGADAAGAAHSEAAKRGRMLSEAAIFLIDYQKYLTDTEVRLLCESRERWHSSNLFLALNKIDMSFQDTGVKSWISSLDFIRARLIDIDPQFSELCIFPVSAGIWSNLLLLKNSVIEHGELQELFDFGNDSLDILPGLRARLRKKLPEELKNALANLQSDAMRIADGLGLARLSIFDLENFSGIPRLARNLRWQVTPAKEAGMEVGELLGQLGRWMRGGNMPESVQTFLMPLAGFF